jgi:hypothetical protein
MCVLDSALVSAAWEDLIKPGIACAAATSTPKPLHARSFDTRPATCQPDSGDMLTHPQLAGHAKPKAPRPKEVPTASSLLLQAPGHRSQIATKRKTNTSVTHSKQRMAHRPNRYNFAILISTISGPSGTVGVGEICKNFSASNRHSPRLTTLLTPSKQIAGKYSDRHISRAIPSAVSPPSALTPERRRCYSQFSFQSQHEIFILHPRVIFSIAPREEFAWPPR